MNNSPAVNDSVPLYSAAQLRELDRLAIESGIPGYTLMTRAAQAGQDVLQASWPDAKDIRVLCGTGNNGGDGFVLARLLQAAGYRVSVLQLGDPARIRGDALTARQDWLAAGGTVEVFDATRLTPADVLVDALLGTGFRSGLDAGWTACIQAINASGVPVLALDVPSGLDSDSGSVGEIAVRAQHTVTFMGRKAGFFTGQGPDHTGAITLADLGLPDTVRARATPMADLYSHPPSALTGRPRARCAHKGDFGHVLVIGGDHGMGGAVRLAGEAALRVGAGRVSVATRASHAAMLAAACPELMCHGVETAAGLKPLLARVTVVVAGPGLGRSSWSRSLLSILLDTTLPAVLDADALNLLARDPQAQSRWVLTPHPGEAARLLQTDTAAIARDRFAAVAELNRRYGGVALLKGAGTLVQAEGIRPAVCGAGNPGMASAGMGDVLAGVIGGLLAQGLSLQAAALTGVCVHAVAADCAARGGERGLLARDVIAALRAAVNAQS
jgi:ADP-dependent NAD(P)H-hydrate dehydratase / NAD(P)H-hydrate epimerase